MIVILLFKTKGGIYIKLDNGITYPVLSELTKEDLEKAITNRERITIGIDTREFSHRPLNGKKMFVNIQQILPIKGGRWMAKGQSFNGLHDVLIFSGTGEDKFLAKTIRILRGGLKVAV